MRVAFATCAAMPDGWEDDLPAAELLGAEYRLWDDPSVDWTVYDRVVLRSVWDYSWRLDEFLAGAPPSDQSGCAIAPELVAFNADKRYLDAIGAPAVPDGLRPTRVGDARLGAEVVVKPNVSAGARDTGRFASTSAAQELIDHIHASGRVALVQPYLESVTERGETELVFLGGELSHVLRKRAVLRDGGSTTGRGGPAAGRAARCSRTISYVAGTADPTELALGEAGARRDRARFGVPLYARIDLVAGEDGRPLVSELELIEPCLYLATAPGAPERLAAAVRAS